MKRSVVASLAIAILVAVVVGALHATGLLVRFDHGVMEYISHYRTATRVVGNKWQYVFILFFALVVAWMTVTTARRGRISWLVLILLAELIGVSWVCSLYRTFFQPLPAMAAVTLAFVAAHAWIYFSTRTRSHPVKTYFAGHLSNTQLGRLIEGEIPLDLDPRSLEVTVVVCDIANKYDLAEEADPAEFAETTEAFIQRTTELFLDAEGYIQAADGEGVVAVFGFPDASGNHADKAVRVTLGLVDSFRKARQGSNGDLFGRCDVHMGVSSGTIIVAPLKDPARPGLLTTGEPVELARRFCVANRFYGSRVLIGPRTFELASKHVVARPIDFLSGVNSQERHEIYEPLWLAAEAKPEHIARRDSFWNGVVLYREKRWAEAYTEFQKARGPDGEDEDAPLQLYLRRLETLALHLTTAPD
ncbi:MAG: adenylate/guanylate cyclase domain-containing protein [Spartobacteria bacterium]